MIIPITALSADALEGIIKEFVLREGTEYGLVEVSLDTKVQQVRRQIQRGEVVLVYEESSESVDLIPKNSKRFRELQVLKTNQSAHGSGDTE